jgi:predicted 2-oxoglutarate/Fe(II)-dependent dioxygenase YbiX
MFLPTIISENIISKDDCELILASLKNKTFDHIPQNYNLPDDPNEDAMRIRTLSIDSQFEQYSLISKLENSLVSFIEKFYGVKVLNVAGQCIVRYLNGQFINIHKDWEPNDPYVLEHKKSQVHLSSVTYINGDFSGGEIVLKEDYIMGDDLVTLKPNAGATVFFSGDKYHVTKPINSGIKYSYTNFYTLDIK